jgi:hypothetical protein
MLFFDRTCREVATILVAREDRVLSWSDRFALRFHLSICETCPRFERQILTIGSSMGRWRNYTDDDEVLNSKISVLNKN